MAATSKLLPKATTKNRANNLGTCLRAEILSMLLSFQSWMLNSAYSSQKFFPSCNDAASQSFPPPRLASSGLSIVIYGKCNHCIYRCDLCTVLNMSNRILVTDCASFSANRREVDESACLGMLHPTVIRCFCEGASNSKQHSVEDEGDDD